jgi:hypothetical protein
MLIKTMPNKYELLFRQPLFSVLSGLHIAAALLFVVSTRPTGWLILPATFIPLRLLGYGRQLLDLPLYWGKATELKLISLAGWRFWLLVFLYLSSVAFGLWFGLYYRPQAYSQIDFVRYSVAVVTGAILPLVYLLAVRSIATTKGQSENVLS